jgi:hypothetical protein
MNANRKAEGLNTTLLSLSLRKARRFTFHGGKETFLQLMFMPVMKGMHAISLAGILQISASTEATSLMKFIKQQ